MSRLFVSFMGINREKNSRLALCECQPLFLKTCFDLAEHTDIKDGLQASQKGVFRDLLWLFKRSTFVFPVV